MKKNHRTPISNAPCTPSNTPGEFDIDFVARVYSMQRTMIRAFRLLCAMGDKPSGTGIADCYKQILLSEKELLVSIAERHDASLKKLNTPAPILKHHVQQLADARKAANRVAHTPATRLLRDLDRSLATQMSQGVLELLTGFVSSDWPVPPAGGTELQKKIRKLIAT